MANTRLLIEVTDYPHLVTCLLREVGEGDMPHPRDTDRLHHQLLANGIAVYVSYWPAANICFEALPGYCRDPKPEPTHKGACGSCRYCLGGNCGHPKREAHWRVPMTANCFGHNHDWEQAARRTKPSRQMVFSGDAQLTF
jgi:hypothetical protein